MMSPAYPLPGSEHFARTNRQTLDFNRYWRNSLCFSSVSCGLGQMTLAAEVGLRTPQIVAHEPSAFLGEMYTCLAFAPAPANG